MTTELMRYLNEADDEVARLKQRVKELEDIIRYAANVRFEAKFRENDECNLNAYRHVVMYIQGSKERMGIEDVG